MIFNWCFSASVSARHLRKIRSCRFLSSSEMTLIRKIINTNNAPRPIAPYNQGVVLESTLYVSGCLGLDKDTMKLVEGDVTSETRQALKNLGHILQAANSSYDKVIKSTIFMSDINDFAAINEVYKEFFTKDYPARSAFQVGKLPLNAKVEIEVVAAEIIYALYSQTFKNAGIQNGLNNMCVLESGLQMALHNTLKFPTLPGRIHRIT